MDSKNWGIIRFVIYLNLFFITAMISVDTIANTYTYDHGWAAFITFIFIGMPFFIGGIIVMAILLKIKVKLYYEIASATVIVILMILSFSTAVHKSGLPGESWEYEKDFSELYELSLGINDEHDIYRVFLGETNTQGREVAIYRYVRSYDEWQPIEKGIEIDGKLFIDNWQVYPTEYVGISHIGENQMDSGQSIYIDHLTTMADTYTLYLKNNSGNFITNLKMYNVTIGDVLVVYGEWQDGPEGICGTKGCDILIVEKIEVVEVLS